MNRVFISVCVLMCVAICEGKWCVQKVTTNLSIVKVLSRTRMIAGTWYSANQVKTETYMITESVPVTKELRVCCEGYFLNKNTSDCTPSCPAGCPDRAHCVKNTCECDPGLVLNENLCRPACDQCVNGRCTETGVCECNPQYVMYDGSCRPICDQKCTNGFCAAPNRCECDKGYLQSPETKRCEPVCEQTCGANAYCSAPNVCICNYGFFGNASDVCQPWCKTECKNGKCVGWDNCECYQGFVKIDGLCIPDCHLGCMYGNCLDVGVCRCWPGFVYNNDTKSCQGSLGVEITTKRDVISTTTTTMAAPYQSIKRLLGDMKMTSTTTPPKNIPYTCEFQVCAQGICYCREGCVLADLSCRLQDSIYEVGDCVPEFMCKPPAETFVFTTSTPRTVALTTTTTTISTSPTTTTTTTSTSPTTTTTTTTTSTSPTTTTTTTSTTTPPKTLLVDCDIENCVDGVCSCQKGCVRADLSCPFLCPSCQIGDCVLEAMCQPIVEVSSEPAPPKPTTDPSTNCETGCWAGICLNGVCQCPDGLILNEENDCIMPCEKSCKNGICSQDKTCVCHLGFVLKNGTECVPQCDKECVNSFCIAPNRCECIEGYIPQLNASSAHVCLPTCDGVDGEEGCLNGTCVAVNKCQCLEGFTPKPGNRFECIPIVVRPDKHHGYFWYIYLLLGLLILLTMAILGLYALRRIHQGTYNVDKVEKNRGTVKYKNTEQPYCYI